MNLETYVWERDGGICVYCRDAVGQHLEHVIPVSMNGPRIRGNIVLSCAKCNARKAKQLNVYLPIAMRHLVTVGEPIEWLTKRIERIEIAEQKEHDIQEMLELDGYVDETTIDELQAALNDLQYLQWQLEAVQREVQRAERAVQGLKGRQGSSPERPAETLQIAENSPISHTECRERSSPFGPPAGANASVPVTHIK